MFNKLSILTKIVVLALVSLVYLIYSSHITGMNFSLVLILLGIFLGVIIGGMFASHAHHVTLKHLYYFEDCTYSLAYLLGSTWEYHILNKNVLHHNRVEEELKPLKEEIQCREKEMESLKGEIQRLEVELQTLHDSHEHHEAEQAKALEKYTEEIFPIRNEMLESMRLSAGGCEESLMDFVEYIVGAFGILLQTNNTLESEVEEVTQLSWSYHDKYQEEVKSKEELQAAYDNVQETLNAAMEKLTYFTSFFSNPENIEKVLEPLIHRHLEELLGAPLKKYAERLENTRSEFVGVYDMLKKQVPQIKQLRSQLDLMEQITLDSYRIMKLSDKFPDARQSLHEMFEHYDLNLDDHPIFQSAEPFDA